MKVLVADDLSADGVAILKKGSGLTVDVKVGLKPPELKAIIEYGVQAASADMSWKAIERNSADYIELKKAGIKFYKTPDAILRAAPASGRAITWSTSRWPTTTTSGARPRNPDLRSAARGTEGAPPFLHAVRGRILRCNHFFWRSTASRPGSARPSPGARCC